MRFWPFSGVSQQEAEKVVTGFAYLSQKIAEWLCSVDPEVLLTAINAAINTYETARVGRIQAVRGPQEPIALPEEAGYLATAAAYAQTGLQRMREFTANYVAEPVTTNKAAELKASVGGVIRADNVLQAMRFFSSFGLEAWQPERTFRRTSLAVLMMQEIANAFLDSDSGRKYSNSPQLRARNFYLDDAMRARDAYVVIAAAILAKLNQGYTQRCFSASAA